MTKSPRKNVPDVGIELWAACMPSEHASDRATAPGRFFLCASLYDMPWTGRKTACLSRVLWEVRNWIYWLGSHGRFKMVDTRPFHLPYMELSHYVLKIKMVVLIKEKNKMFSCIILQSTRFMLVDVSCESLLLFWSFRVRSRMLDDIRAAS